MKTYFTLKNRSPYFLFLLISSHHIYSENQYLLNTHISYDKLLLTRKLLDLRLI